MAIYITQGSFSEQAYRGFLERPEDRSEVVSKLFERAGCRLIDYYVTFGESDFLVITEAPSETEVMRVLVAVAGSGGVKNLKTTIGMRTAEAKRAMEGAKGLLSGFRPAGASTPM